MVDLSIGAASALIAASIAILQFILPNALVLVLSGRLSDVHSAVTWSVVSRFLLGSDWPLILRSDAATSRAVDRKISAVTWVKPIGLLLISIAAVVTPLGLYDGVYPSSNAEYVLFTYAPDSGPIAKNTRVDKNFGFSRTCGFVSFSGASEKLCPGEPDVGNATYMYWNIFKADSNISTEREDPYTPVSVRIRTPGISANLIETYQAGLENQLGSLSGSFDIAFRQYTTESKNYTIHNSSYVVPAFKQSVSHILENKVIFVEGLIADFENGGVGFRNHSVPTGLQYGAEWEEEILWWTPEIECVNTNVTLFMRPGAGGTVASYGIVDRGGFVSLPKNDPFPAHREFHEMDAQKSAGLWDRAYYGAWSGNTLAMMNLDIVTRPTNISTVRSAMAQEFRVNSGLGPSIGSYTKPEDWMYPSVYRSLDGLVDADSAFFSTSSNPQLANSYNISSEQYGQQRDYLEQTSGVNPLNISRIDAKLAMVAGPAYDSNGQPASSFDVPGQMYESPTYVCAAATRVSIKRVRFKFNSTKGALLNGLYLLDLKDKQYINDDYKPIWGMEMPRPQWNVSELDPIYGMFDRGQAQRSDIATVQSDRFYVPSGRQSRERYDGVTVSGGNNLPATVAPPKLWTSAFNHMGDTSYPDYSGKVDFRVLMRWQELFRNNTGTAQVFKLIWTDYAMNYVTGTKGLHNQRYQPPSGAPSKRATGDVEPATFPVFVLEHRLRYNWLYGIPAGLGLSVVVVVLFMALFSLIFGDASVARLRYYLFSITSGRVFASYEYPEHNEYRMTQTKEWVETVGHKLIDVSTRSGDEVARHRIVTKNNQYASLEQSGS